MKYIVDIAEKRLSVDLNGTTAAVEEQNHAVQIASVEGTPVKLITIGGTQHRVVARRDGARGRYIIWMDGWRFEVEALDERRRAIKDLGAASAASTGPAPVTAPMPGLVVKVQVEVGDSVAQGQPVVTMEAMKMENELRSSAAGTVKAVHAVPGKAVEKGALLVELE